MIAKQELRTYAGKEQIWIGKYRNLGNMPHWHFDYEICYVEEGGAKAVCDGKEYLLKKGDTLFIDGKRSHSIRSAEGTLLTFIIFTEELAAPIANGYRLSSPLLAGRYDIPAVYDAIKTEIRGKDAHYMQASCCELYRLLIEIARREVREKDESGETDGNDFYSLLKEIDKNYSYYTFEDAARYMGLNKTYFSSLFHKFAGMTFSQYLNRVRVEKAVERLQKNDGAKITDVAMDCGFYTLRNFNRIFKEITGYAPKQLPAGYRLAASRFFTVNEQFNPLTESTVLVDAPCAV